MPTLISLFGLRDFWYFKGVSVVSIYS